MKSLHNGYHDGVYVSTSHDGRFVHDHVFVAHSDSHCSSHFHDHHHHHGFYPGFAFSVGFGFPIWASYYASYPWWGYDPYYVYPYSRGVYVGYDYPPPPPYYYSDRTYVYHTPAPAVAQAPAQAEAPGAESVIEGEARAVEPPSGAGSQVADAQAITRIPASELAERGGRPIEPLGVADRPSAREALKGLADFRGGAYSDAAESLFAASQGAPESALLKVYLAESLFAIGEYRFAAEYLRQAIEAQPELAARPFPLGQLYAPSAQGETDLVEHLTLLAEWVRTHPYDTDALLVLGFMQLNAGRPQEASATLLSLRETAPAMAERTLAARLIGEAAARSGASSAEQGEALLARPAATTAPSLQSDELGELLARSLES